MSQWRLRTSLLVIAVVCAVMAPIPTSRPASATPELLAQTSPTSSGYWMLEKDGTVYNFGGSQHFGNADWTASAVALVPTVTAGGYWIVSKFGGVAAYGDAPTFESAYAEIPDGETVTTAATTPSGQGLWLFTDSGRVIVRGDARQFGDLTHLTLDGPIVGSSATPTGGGYLMVGGDGGVFAFGDAVFRGSIPGILPPGTRLDKPVVGVSTSPSNLGYWMVASDGGIFAFGDSAFRGSIPGVLPGVTLNQPVNGMVPYGNGYLMVASDGGIFNFSDLEFLGSLGANPPDTAIVGVAPMPHVPVLPAATWVNSDTTSSLLWVTEFEPNAAGARRVAWYGTRTGNTFAPSRGELFVDSDVPVVIHLTNDGSGLQSIVGPDGTKATVVRYLTDSQVIVMVEEPGGGQRSELVDLRSVPASPPPPSPVGARSVSSPPEARAALPRDLPDRWPLLARPAVLDLDLQKVPVDADIDVSLTRTTTRCSSVGNDDLMCATN
ncbi:MAG: hypothetical protein GY925_14150, partial [Actinomycetia bacterium]|nr:hypothetical protein [Actinomycetes bacterium]